jgi:hypothetical protein
MVDLASTAIIIGLFGGLVVAAIIALKYWLELTSIKNDRSKQVILLDLDGHIRNLGKYRGIGMKDNKYTIKTFTQDTGLVEWIIELGTKYHFEGISKDYESTDMNILVIFTDFIKSDLQQFSITPLVDGEVLKLGLTKGLRAINDKSNPLYDKIEVLEAFNTELLQTLQDQVIEFDQGRLDAIRELKVKNKELLDEVMAEYMSAPDYLKAKIVSKRPMSQKTPPQTTPQPTPEPSSEKIEMKPGKKGAKI